MADWAWEIIIPIGGGDGVRRLRIVGGWLYQSERSNFCEPLREGEPGFSEYGWHPPVFVPEVSHG